MRERIAAKVPEVIGRPGQIENQFPRFVGCGEKRGVSRLIFAPRGGIQRPSNYQAKKCVGLQDV